MSASEAYSVSIPVFAETLVVSTNDTAWQRVQAGTPLPFAVTATAQSKGRGRREHSFHSPEGGLYFTFATSPLPDRLPGQITCAAAVAAAEAIRQTFDLAVTIKWINDLILNNRKVGGILTEQKAGNALLIGIGLNLWTSSFPQDIASLAGALLPAKPARDPRPALAHALVHALQKWLHQPPAAMVPAYRELLFRLNLPVLVRSGKMEGESLIVRGVTLDGKLLAELPDGTAIALADGELSLSQGGTL